jgi:hypothetical protein
VYLNIVKDEIRYRGIYFSSFRPSSIKDVPSANDKGFQNQNGYYCKQTYWSKFCLISWKALVINIEEGKVLLFSNLILDSQNCSNSNQNKYNQSYIRSWL